MVLTTDQVLRECASYFQFVRETGTANTCVGTGSIGLWSSALIHLIAIKCKVRSILSLK